MKKELPIFHHPETMIYNILLCLLQVLLCVIFNRDYICNLPFANVIALCNLLIYFEIFLLNISVQAYYSFQNTVGYFPTSFFSNELQNNFVQFLKSRWYLDCGKYGDLRGVYNIKFSLSIQNYCRSFHLFVSSFIFSQMLQFLLGPSTLKDYFQVFYIFTTLANGSFSTHSSN